MNNQKNKSLTIVTPIYNDLASFNLLLPKIDSVLSGLNITETTLLIINDGSSESIDIYRKLGILDENQRQYFNHLNLPDQKNEKREIMNTVISDNTEKLIYSKNNV